MFKKLAIIGALAVPMFGMSHGANAAETTHRVKNGETLYKIALNTALRLNS